MVIEAARAIRSVNPERGGARYRWSVHKSPLVPRPAPRRARIVGPSLSPARSWRHHFRAHYRAIPRGLMDVGLNVYPSPTHPARSVRDTYRMARRFT
jgi:hypothetical protein